MADFAVWTPSTGVAVAAGSEAFVVSYITPAGRPHYLKRIKINARSADASHVHAVFRIIQADTDGTGTANALILPMDARVTVSLPTSKHTYTAGPTTNIKQRWQAVIPPQGAAEYSLVDPQTGLGIMIEPGKVCAVGVTCTTAGQTIDVELLAAD